MTPTDSNGETLEPEQEGMSTTKKVAAGAAAGIAIPAAVGVARKLLGDEGDDSGDEEGGASARSGGQRSRSASQRSRSASQRSRSASSRSRPKTSSGARSRAASKSSQSGRSRASGSASSSGSSRSGSGRTKEQLYATAKRLKIEGRSKMSKAQLERAVERARR